MSQTISLLITVSLVVLRLSLYSSQSPLWYSDYPYTHHSLSGGTQTIPILTTVSLLVDHHILFGGTQTNPIRTIVSLVVLRISPYSPRLRLSLFSSQSPSWYPDYPYTHHSLPGGSDNPYTHHSLLRGTQTIPLPITVCLVVLGLSLYSSQSPWWYSDYHYTNHSLPGHTQTIPVFITAALAVLRLSLCTSQSPWCYSKYPYKHHSLPYGTQTIPIDPYRYHSIPDCTQTLHIDITASLVVLKLSLYTS